VCSSDLEARKDLRRHLEPAASDDRETDPRRRLRPRPRAARVPVSFVNRLLFANRKQLSRTSSHRKRTCISSTPLRSELAALQQPPLTVSIPFQEAQCLSTTRPAIACEQSA